MRRNARRLAGDGGQPRLWLGVNYWSRQGGPFMWRDYDGEFVATELRQLREHGITLTRSFLFWPDVMPAESTLDEAILAHYDDFLERHRALGMTTIPTFIVGHMSGQNWAPSWRRGRDVFTDASFVEQQRWYVRQLAGRWRDHPAIAGWLLSNEIPIYADPRSGGVGTLDSDSVTAWARDLIGEIRDAGAPQPVSVGDGGWGIEVTGCDNGFRLRELASSVDFHGPHVYASANDQVRQHLHAAFVCELLDIGGLPVVMEEFGVTDEYVSEVNAAHFYRQFLHTTLLAGATGWIPWNNTDYDDLADREPYVHHPFEMHFGLTDRNGRPKAQLAEVRAFSEVLRRTDAARLQRPDTDIAVVVSSFLEAEYPFTVPADASSVVEATRQAYIASREADLPAGLARELDGLPDDCRLYVIPSAKQLLGPTWSRLRELADAGATVYASYFVGEHGSQRGSWWPCLDETFGVLKQLRYGLVDAIEDDEVEFVIQRPFGHLSPGDRLRFRVGGRGDSAAFLPVEPDDAEVIAVDGHGPPALLRHRVGRGALVLCTYPLEHLAACTPHANPEDTWQVYSALAAEAGVTPPVTVADPNVLASVLDHEDGRRFAWFVNQSPAPASVTPLLNQGKLADLDGAPCTDVSLDPFGVTVCEISP
ncbi:hypothetical protein Ae168Ps1_4644c [Pseudonocardia sp. Ae168_Ps1]|uniref:glycoside hydrolase 5 family protein n=1 Tax=unclassified Pseudonocardia TaxID=2619320 RepID=UPI00094B11E1|nr:MULTISPECIES: cellulase family glycosylhydrolase [unclassified Pseudonocardia]OLL76239.1 hypothetical protein Ae150APs1_4617c [Pseudonocardia sp. Ae150A_Ps1]OLL82238.1 hypothetical protein Ae168Ps1_4644c [Pseudonocardia sp. Ae168_Ps1]OLL83646.1 hypothetical protein Ae263Ps1_0701 [Pseudonocardia sp. Ae263_Ps1]OLL90314.1 hypothetical protein Ae356Ps1_0211c [Pseudonocardia sp. Ae356_Ps1]